MDTKYPLFLVMALAGATLIWSMSGIGALYGQTDPIGSDSQAAEQLREQANKSAATENGSFESTGRQSGDGTIVGTVISGGKFIVNFGTIVTHLPDELMKLGFPSYFAGPLGILSQALIGIGIVQLLSDRIYR